MPRHEEERLWKQAKKDFFRMRNSLIILGSKSQIFGMEKWQV